MKRTRFHDYRSTAVGRALVLVALAALVALVVGGCGDEGNDQLTDANVSGQCPSQQLKGKPATFSVQVENTGEEEWPAAFVEFTGFRSIVEDDIIDGSGNKGQFWGGRDFTTYRFSQLAAGATQSYKVTVIPQDAVNRSDVTFAAWGDEPNPESLEPSPEIEIQECDGPWGDGR
jgi:hypothetical protein